MNATELTENWALWAAAVPGLIVIVSVGRYLLRRTAGGRLRQVLKKQRQATKTVAKAHKLRAKAEARVRKLDARAQKVKPRILQEAREALEDALALQKIADDNALVQANHVRRVIFEEFPPARHEKLRAKYLPQDVEDGRPFTF